MYDSKRGQITSYVTESPLTDAQNLHQHLRDAGKQQHYLLIGLRLASVQLALAVVLFASFILFGYSNNLEYFYRPFSGSPATHPFTAALFVSLGISVLLLKSSKTPFLFKKVFLSLALSVAVFSISDHIFTTSLFPASLAFSVTITQEKLSGLSNQMSLNTSLMLLLIALSQIFYLHKKYSASQVLSFTAIGIPCLSFIGYIYDIEDFHSHMSLYTALLGFMLGWSVLAGTAHKSSFRALLSPYIGGRIARIQVLVGIFVPFLLGMAALPLYKQGDATLIAVLIIFLTWIFVLMFCISASVQEQTEISRQEMTDKLIKAATTDSLTGLLNRQMFFEIADRESYKEKTRKDTATLLVIDVDDFKNINDTLGHSTGDMVLKGIAHSIKSSVRDTDLAFRIGGDEFTAIIFSSSRKVSERIAHSILETVSSINVDIDGTKKMEITVSIGASTIKKDKDIQVTLQEADQAMYSSKQSGKNTVIFNRS
jgi:diguanylate cyclase (GGDEF)-like protein